MTRYHIGAVEGGSELLPQINSYTDPGMAPGTILVKGVKVGKVEGRWCLNFFNCEVEANGWIDSRVGWDTPLSVGRSGLAIETKSPVHKQVFLVEISFGGCVAVIKSMTMRDYAFA
jgi:hypothetical protein